ncbi:MAG: UDP-N-acetylmuramoyl-L-alanine--D-glutamate ligase [Dethiobacteria bacterium]|nr:UDP-N-acetylmuramoyl-L-alanine--D-glutamate ligase [Bacillota bacterium]
MLDIRGKRVLLIGAARSGLAAMKFLANQGAQKILLNEYRAIEELDESENLLREIEKYPQISLVDRGHPLKLLDEPFDMIIKSPGVPSHLPLLQKAKFLQIPVLTEVEIAYHCIKAPIIGITGTNGKTTTTMLVGEIFKAAGGGNVFLAGNIGVPMCSFAEETGATDIVVAELSSFQLESIQSFRSHIAVILNITEDHLDYHRSFESYLEAKARILENQQSMDFAIFNADSPEVLALAERARGRVLLFSRDKELESGVFVNNGQIFIRNAGYEFSVCPVDKVAIRGPHNLENALAATAAAWAGGIAPQIIGYALQRFKGVEHRLEFVAEINGIKFVNDSKGTNPEATTKALQSFPGKKILIAGGKDKGGSFKQLARVIKDEVSYLILLGETAGKISDSVKEAGFNNYVIVKDMADAVKEAYNRAHPQEAVLLSPACASWDMFKSFEERGNLFKKLVHELRGVPTRNGEDS